MPGYNKFHVHAQVVQHNNLSNDLAFIQDVSRLHGLRNPFLSITKSHVQPLVEQSLRCSQLVRDGRP
jgi:hypothetical protein